jgi:hypothetical protein
VPSINPSSEVATADWFEIASEGTFLRTTMEQRVVHIALSRLRLYGLAHTITCERCCGRCCERDCGLDKLEIPSDLPTPSDSPYSDEGDLVRVFASRCC